MSSVSDSIPRSDMTLDQRRRIGALQVAQQQVGCPSQEEHVDWLIAIAHYIETGRTHR